MTASQWLTIVMIWMALICYTIGVVQMLLNRWTKRTVWTWGSGVVFFWLHVLLAFAAFYQGSFAVAYEETRRQTAETIGWDNGNGLYANFLFGVLWTWDAAILCWRGSAIYRSRSRAALLGVHAFLALMFFHGTVVFGDGPVRWLGLLATTMLAAMAWNKTWRRAHTSKSVV